MFTVAASVIAALSLAFGEASEPLNWVSIEATGSYIAGASGKSCHVIPETFEVRADGKKYQSSEFNLTGSMDEDCGISITLTIPLDEGPPQITGSSYTNKIDAWQDTLDTQKEKMDNNSRNWLNKFKETDMTGSGQFPTGDNGEKPKDTVTVEQEKEKLENSKKNLEEARSELEKDMNDLKKIGQEIQDQKAELDKQKAALQALGADKAAELAKLDQKLVKLMRTLAGWSHRLRMLKKQVKLLETRKKTLEGRLKLMEDKAQLAGQRKALDEEKTTFQLAETDFSAIKKNKQKQMDDERQKVEKEKTEWEEKLKERREALDAKKKHLEDRRQKLKNRRDALQKSVADRVAKSAQVTENQNGIIKQLKDLEKMKQKSILDAKERLENITQMYDNCEAVSEDLKIIIASWRGVGIEHAWICSLEQVLANPSK